MYRALYRKWRPQQFADVVGQEAITTALSNQILHDKIGHAYLFTGTRGTGKTTCAKLFAKAVNCEDRHGAEPCGKCATCIGMDNGSILDVAEIDAASNNGVDDVRSLRDETAYRPGRSRFRVYIIDEVHMLSTAAFNALLKILEEPPSHVIFILATTESHKVPATILSRCQRFDFMRIPAEKIAQRLAFVAGEEGMSVTPEAADLIARLADGAMRDALSLLDTCAGVSDVVDEALVRQMAGVADKRYLFAISDAVAIADRNALIRQLATLQQGSIDVRRLCEELVLHFRSILLAQAADDGSLLEQVPLNDRPSYMEAGQKIDKLFPIRAMRRLAEALDRMSRSPEPRVELEMALFDLVEKAGPEAAVPTPNATQQAAPSSVMANTDRIAENKAKEAASAAAMAEPKSTKPDNDTPAAPTMPSNDMPADAPFAIDEQTHVIDKKTDVADIPIAEHATTTATDTVPETEPIIEATSVEVPAIETVQQPEMLEPTPDGVQPFALWPQVLASMANVDRMLYSYMRDSRAYEDGRYILIQGGEMFLTFMRENAFAGERIKTVIQQVSGKKYNIGPYKQQAATPVQAAATSVEGTLQKWEEMGVQIEYVD